MNVALGHSLILYLTPFQSLTEISFELPGYFLEPSKDGLIITAPGGVSMLKEGAPDLPIFTASIQIPDLAKMELIMLWQILGPL